LSTDALCCRETEVSSLLSGAALKCDEHLHDVFTSGDQLVTAPWRRKGNRLRVFAYPRFKLFLASFRINLDAELSTVSGHDSEFAHVPQS
jgi:hypothetical protein